MLTTKTQNRKFNLRLTRSWPSFEKFRSEGAKALASIKDGAIATITTKTGQYKIIEESDFQAIQGLARDVDRLQGGLSMITVAVRAVQKHPDEETIAVLTQAVAQLGELPQLPTRNSFQPLEVENLGWEEEEDDDLILDPHKIERPLEA
ncbi:hypothetical protein Xen7305DRAFT_00048570 [Xenococcus sp. PCC 7305]|uniref:hypothetical protein n=1 Tax=Xenococcus sp. PCC 7305 TaxID=102125 RepID=UPI0002ACA284|nr:hypothetical protein [Xenococcus sp. PCC 7305]ELS05117.1 hypothetical protein Xen7305DRAFT_00048570 [Xenococcus sp. PCC 7305]